VVVVMLFTVADVHSRPHGSPPVSSLDYVNAAPEKPYGDSYGPPPFGDVSDSPRRLRYVC